MPCGNEISDWDDKAVLDSLLCKNTELDPKILEEAKPLVEAAVTHKFTEILRNPAMPGHEVLKNAITQWVPGNESISTDYANKFPHAFAKVIEHTPNALGVFTPPPAYYGRGGGPQSQINGLKHSTRGDAFLYQAALGPAALMTREYKAGNSSFVLKIEPTDRVDNLIKLREPYFTDEKLKFGKGETDNLIHRSYEKVIGIDYKHSRSGNYKNIPDQGTLDGIKAAIQNGYIHKFCFVTNGKFSDLFKEKIKNMNGELSKSELISEEEMFSKEEKDKYFTKEERNKGLERRVLYFENVMYDQ